ncbi:glycosyltransferase family 2 protein [Fretibacter rubidus]|uniref:glycosyltransferase family 2 protein n=1 Tax=Fretibacter rubidus TaxID=570162 RepID=UPI00352B4468
MATTPTSLPRASVIIVNYNGGAYLARCVASLLNQTEARFEAFIVDNGSTDGSLERLPGLDARFTIIKAGENLGFAAANNLAAHKAKADWLALLNPDAFARPDWLEKLLSETRHKDVTMVGSLQYMALEPETLDGAGDFYHASGLAWRAGFGHPMSSAPTEASEAFAPCGAGALYHRETFLSLGGFDERFFCYFEDVDMGYRMRLIGGRCIQSAGAIIDHISSGISGRASDFAVYHGTRNRIWTFFKNTPFALLIILLPLHIAMNLFILFWAGLRSGRFAPTWRGIKDGIGGLSQYGILPSARKSKRTISLSDVARMMCWRVGPVRKRAVPPYHPTSPDE